MSSPMVNLPLPTVSPSPQALGFFNLAGMSPAGQTVLPPTPSLQAIQGAPLADQFIPLGSPALPTPPASPALKPQALNPQVSPMGQAQAPSALNPKSDEAIISQALNLLGGIQHLPQEEAYIRHLGLSPCFHNGQEALRMIQNNKINVVFGDMGDSAAHAQWVADQRTIMVNQKYRGDNSPTTLYAISEALYHEAGHAANVVTDPRTGQHVNLSILGTGPTSIGDDESSLQEELDCMALNSLAHGYHEAIDPDYAKAASTSRLLHDGVQLYYRYLLHDPDPYKNAIINRMVQKYGELPLSSPGHEPPPPMEPFAPLPLSYRIIQRIQQQTPCPAAATHTLSQQQPASSPTASSQMAYWA